MILNLSIEIECDGINCNECRFQFMQNCILFSEELNIVDSKKTKCNTCIEKTKDLNSIKSDILKNIPDWD